MLKVPPTRIPLATVQIGGQRVELLLAPEWARYFESLNSQVLAVGAALEQTAALTAFLGDQSETPDAFPGMPGPQGMEGAPGAALFMLQECAEEQAMLVPPCVDGVYVPLNSKDAPGGVPGLTQLKLNLRNALGTITSWFTTAATAARTWTMPDKDGTVALLSDFAAPPAIGSGAPASGAFTTVTAKSTSQYGIVQQGGLTSGGKIYAGTLVGVASAPNQSGGFGYVYDPTTPTASFFHLTPWGSAEGSKFKLDAMGNLTAGAGFGCNGKAAQPAAASGGTLAGVIAALVANGILSS